MNPNAQRRVGFAALLLSASLIASRLLGFVRDAVIAYRLGAGPETDAYYAAFFVPDLLNYLLSGGALSITFIPLFARYLQEGDAARGWRLLSNVVTILGGALLVATAAAFVSAPTLIAAWYPDFDAAQVELTVKLTRIVLFGPLFFLVGGLLNAAEMAYERFTAAALMPLVYNACIIAGGLFLEPWMGVAGFSVGAMVGVILGPFAVPALFVRRHARLRLSASLRDPDFKRYIELAIPLMFGVSLVFFDERIAQRVATEDGAITWLNNARRLLLVPVGIIGQSLGQAALPTLSRLFAADRHEELHDTLCGAIRVATSLSVIGGCALALAAAPIAAIVYGRGAYTLEDTLATAALLRWLALGTVAWSLQPLLVRGFFAREVMWAPMWLGTALVVAAYPLYGALHTRFGTEGLALASALALSAHAFGLVALHHVRFGRGLWSPILRGLVDAAPGAALGGAAAWFVHSAVFGTEPTAPTSPLLQFAVLGASFALPALGGLFLTNSPGAGAVLAMARKLLAKLQR